MALSNKRHLFLTGSRGAGKSTLLKLLAEDYPEAPGFVTRVQPGREVQMEDRRTGESFPIGIFDPSLMGKENRMCPIRENLESRGAEILRICREGESPWAVLDEIGYLEADSPGYIQALEELLEHKRVLAAVRKQEIPFLRNLLCREDACVIDLDVPFGRLGCVIMASGLGKRFGGNKLLADFGGAPLICRALDATEGIFDKRVVVTRHEEVAQLCRERKIAVILHDLPERSDTVRLGMEWMGQDIDGCLFCPGDQPLLSRETVELMALCADGAHILQLSFNGRTGTPVLFPQWCFPQLQALPRGKGGNVLVRRYPSQVRTVSAKKEQELMDADTKAELEKLKTEGL